MIAISEAKSLDKWRIQYKEPLEIAKSHIKSGNGPKNGTSISEKRRKEMLRFEIECVHCGMLLNNGNHNTEHILDKSLGGDNNDKNRMLMCGSCNSWRNGLKAEFLKEGLTIKNWPKIEKYILWNFITVDYGHKAGQWIPEVHQAFLRFRFTEGRDFEAPGKIWFARAADSTPKEINPRRADVSKAGAGNSSLFARATKAISATKSWLSGSSHDKKRAEQMKDGASPPRVEPAAKPPDISEQIAMTKEERLASIVRPHLPEKGSEMNLSNLSTFVRKDDQNERSLKDIATELGFPKSWTLTKLLTHVLGGDISIRKEGHISFISSITTSLQKPSKPREPSIEPEKTERGSLLRQEVRKHLLAGEEIYLGAFAKKYYETTSTRLKSKISEFGFPKSWTILKSITTAFGPLMHVREDGREVYIQLADYQPCKNFNRSKGFMSYPQTPQLLRVFWDAYASSVPNTLGWLEVKAQLSETSGISRGRLLSPMMVLQRCLGGSQEQPVPWSAVSIATFVSNIRQAIDDADDEVFSNLEEEGIADWYLHSFQAIVEARGTEEE